MNTNNAEKKLTGYPSIDKPWLKYYSEEAIKSNIPQGSMYEYLLECNKGSGNNVALIYFGKKITYGTLFKEIDRIASALIASGVKKGDYISIVSLSTPESIYLFYAINKVGAIACMEYVTLTPDMLIKSVETIKPKMLFILDLFYKSEEEYTGLNTEVVILPLTNSMPFIAKTMVNIKNKSKDINNAISYNDFIKRTGANVPVVRNNASATCVLLSTSGSTGIPKKVALNSTNINSVVAQYKYTGMDFKRKERFIGVAPIFHSFGLIICIHLPLTEGLEQILCLDDKKFFSEMRKFKANHAICINALIPYLYEDSKELSYLKTLSIGGESMSPEQTDEANNFLKKYGSAAKLITGYGMTELSSAAITELTHITRRGSIGIPLPKINVKITDTDTGEELGYEKSGEIMINSAGVMQEYLNNSEETSNTICKDSENNSWLHTGDIGKIDKDGFIYILGRMKRIYMYKNQSDGVVIKMFPDYIEHIILSHNDVKQCAVAVISDEKYLNIPIAFVVLNSNKSDIIEHLNSHILSVSSEYNVPKKYFFVDEIPLLPNGKKDYKTLEKMAEEKTK